VYIAIGTGPFAKPQQTVLVCQVYIAYLTS